MLLISLLLFPFFSIFSHCKHSILDDWPGGEGGQGESGQKNIITAFNTNLMAEAMEISEDLMRKIERKDEKGFLVKVRKGDEHHHAGRRGRKREGDEAQQEGNKGQRKRSGRGILQH